VQNALAASTLAYFLKIPMEFVLKAIQSYAGFENRFETKQITGDRGLIVSDCYNANPESMRAAILAFDQMAAKGKKIAVLGDMLELGEKEAFWHRQIGRLLSKTASIDAVVLVGERSRMIYKTAPSSLTVEWTETWQDAQAKLELLLTDKDALVLVKASHGMVLNNIVDAVTQS
jgi:UDP-N-acetylmuramoyl-tripeptide--D-alanyl-D-alanine ligase